MANKKKPPIDKGISSAGFNLSVFQKIIVILMGGLLMGGMWRLRGDDGFGSFWGMLPVSVVFWLFIISIFGYRKKISYDMLPWVVLSIPFTINAWMPVMPLLQGYIDAPGIDGAAIAEKFSPMQSLFPMFCMGFCWMTFLGFFLGRYFSVKRFKFWDYLIIVAVYYAAALIVKHSLAHLLVNVFSPKVTEVFGRGLAELGVADSPMMFYLKNSLKFGSQKPYLGGRSYFNCISVIGNAFGGLSVLAMLIFRHKDKVAARIMAAVNSLVALGFFGGALINVLAVGGFNKAYEPK